MRAFSLRPINLTRLFFVLLAPLTSIIAVSPVISSESSSHAQTINLHDAVLKTIEHNPSLRAFDFQLKAQQGRVQQSGIAPSPSVNFQLEDALGTGRNNALRQAQATLSISWVLERGVRQRYINAAQAGTSLIKSEADVKQLDAAAETARRYLVSLAYQARAKIADKTVQLAQETIIAVRKRVKAGKIPKAELSRAQAELARRKLQREDISHQILTANRRLAAQWGETTPRFTRVDGDVTLLPKITSFATLKSQLPQNPEFARLLSNQQLKETELALVLAREKPSWQLNTGVRQLNTSNSQAFVAGFSIPFGERTRNPGRIAEARANLAKIDREEHAVRTRIETTLYVIHTELQHSLHVINTTRDEIIPPLEQALIETRRAYNIGRYSYLELRAVQTELLNAHNSLIESSVIAQRSIIEIERLTGVRIAERAVKQTTKNTARNTTTQPTSLLKQTTP